MRISALPPPSAPPHPPLLDRIAISAPQLPRPQPVAENALELRPFPGWAALCGVAASAGGRSPRSLSKQWFYSRGRGASLRRAPHGVLVAEDLVQPQHRRVPLVEPALVLQGPKQKPY